MHDNASGAHDLIHGTPVRDRREAQRQRVAASTRELTHLLLQRPDLCGVHAPADLRADMVTWSA